MPISRRTLWLVALPVAVCAGAWWWNAAPALAPVPDRAAVRPITGRSAELARVRASCELEDLGAFIDEQRRRVAAAPTADNLRVLAEALYERVLGRDQRKGLIVGAFVGADNHAANRPDVAEALAALKRAEAAGDRSSELHRIRAGLMTCELTDVVTVLAHRSSIDRELGAALERDPANGRAHVAAGCRLLFVPAWLGQNLGEAVRHFRFAARALPLDERPLVFCAFARFLQGQRQRCIEWLRAARRRNPRNPFVRAVLARLATGEARPFARDVE